VKSFATLRRAGNAVARRVIEMNYCGVAVLMKSLKRDILAAVFMCSIAVVVALAWGSPFVEAKPAFAQATDPTQQALQQLPVKAKPHPGTLSASADR